MQPDDVAMFWVKAGPKRWFAEDDAFLTEALTTQ
jgi:uncharacterized protein (DUF924 family)